MNILRTLVLLALLFVNLRAETFTTTDGEQINGEIKRIEPDGIVLVTESGIHKVKFKTLPLDISKKYGYDPAKAAEFQSILQASSAAAEAEAVKAEQQKEKSKALDELKKTTEISDWKVVQVLQDGVLAIKTPSGYYGYTIYYLEGISGLVEGNNIHDQFVRNGSFSYTDTQGASRTVAKMTRLGSL